MRTHTYTVIICVCIISGITCAVGQTAGEAEYTPSSPREQVGKGTYSFNNDGGETPPLRTAGALGVELAVDVDYLVWQSGVSDLSGLSLSPRLSLVYGLTDSVSLEGGVKFLRAEEHNMAMSALRFGLGPRIEIATQSNIKPFLKAGISLYTNIESENEENENDEKVKETVGFYVSLGSDFEISDNSMIGMAVTFEHLVDTEFKRDEDSDFELRGFGLGLSYTFLF